jgi:membrane protein DedA with SNARE-associated domain
MAGVLAANGSISPWIFLPLGFVATIGGAMIAYTWARALGAGAVETLAERLRARRALERTSTWLRSAGPFRIMGCRLFPGMRIYTGIVCGAARVDLGTFLLGLVPAVLIWLVGFTLVGLLVGEPALASLSHVQHLTVTAGALLLIGVATFFAIRYMPSGEPVDVALLRAPRLWLVLLSGLIDLTIAVSVVSGVVGILHEVVGLNDPDGIIDLALIFAAIGLAYMAVMRHVIGATAGERLLSVRYAFH